VKTAADASPPFHSGWIGTLSYDLGRIIEPAVHRRASIRNHPAPPLWPLIELPYCPHALAFDHLKGQWYGTGDLADLTARIQSLGWGLSDLALENGDSSTPAYSLDNLKPSIDPDRYTTMVGRAIEYIRAGDIFQANIAQRFEAEFAGSPRALAGEALRQARPWYGAYLELARGHDQNPGSTLQPRALISLSPELFLKVDAHWRRVTTRPIKGTRPATSGGGGGGGNTAPDSLYHSAKDAAELHMIVDLMRNDLGRVCEFGSVRVPNPRSIETHPTVHHGVAEITGRLRDDVSVGDLLGATFPGGSVTGAPKIRAMQIIEELELHARGVFCGAIGFFSDCGDVCLNIAIRTLMLRCPCDRVSGTSGTLHYFAGAGIVADSDPLAEYRETLDKAAVLRALCSAPVEPAAVG
jgi:anthranilate/para-aminobenzoate synthase component I